MTNVKSTLRMNHGHTKQSQSFPNQKINGVPHSSNLVITTQNQD